MNDNILQTIRELFNACGAQSFSQICYQVKTQCACPDSLTEATALVKAHLAYLVELKCICRVNDGFGIVWGHPGDF